ncbi:MAG: hypothetical protein WED09_05235 [Homoserinimonas sp.]
MSPTYRDRSNTSLRTVNLPSPEKIADKAVAAAWQTLLSADRQRAEANAAANKLRDVLQQAKNADELALADAFVENPDATPEAPRAATIEAEAALADAEVVRKARAVAVQRAHRALLATIAERKPKWRVTELALAEKASLALATATRQGEAAATALDAAMDAVYTMDDLAPEEGVTRPEPTTRARYRFHTAPGFENLHQAVGLTVAEQRAL